MSTGRTSFVAKPSAGRIQSGLIERLPAATMALPLPDTEAVRRLHAQYATARALEESTSLLEAAPRILRAICESLGWEHGGLWRVDDAARVLRCVETWHAPDVSFPEFEAASRSMAFPAGSGLPGRVWASGKPAWIPDVVHDDNFPRAPIAVRVTREELLSRPYLEFVHPEDRKVAMEEARRVFAGATSDRFEMRALCKDGSYRWLSWNSAPLAEQGLMR